MNNEHNIDYSLYLVTDRSLLQEGVDLEKAVEQSILGGSTMVQLREKNVSTLDFYNIAKKIKAVTDKYNIPLIINDRLDIALSVDATGLHVGQSDMPAAVARKILGDKKILGVSASSLQEAITAEKDGADYIGAGAVFTTGTKKDAQYVSVDTLNKIKQTVNIPVVAIGGINENTVNMLKGTHIDGIAVISAIIAKNDIKKASENLKKLYNSL